MENEQRYHLIDLLEIRITALLQSAMGTSHEFRLLSASQKEDAIKYDKELILLLKKEIEDE